MNRFYTKEEITYILENGRILPAEIIAKYINRSKSGVRKVLSNYGISLAPEFNKTKSTQFVKGQISWNSGLKTKVKPNAGQFIKGSKPHNTKPEGTISLRTNVNRPKQKYYYIKISDGNWVLYHRYLWEQKNGKIPEGMILTFIDGNKLNVNLDNLELMTRYESVKINTNKYRSKSELSDKHIAGLIARKDPETRERLLNFPYLLELKRIQLKLTKEINEAAQ